jgi:hypothetical protein
MRTLYTSPHFFNVIFVGDKILYTSPQFFM